VTFSLLAGLTQAAAAALLITGSAHIWQLAVLEALNGTGAAFLRLATNTAKVLGAGLAGVVVAALGPGWGIAFDAATFVAAQAVGYIAGGLPALWCRPRRPLLVATYGVLAAVPVLATLAMAAPVPVVVVAAFTAGVGLETFGVQWDTARTR
jgi:hypothetical protein